MEHKYTNFRETFKKREGSSNVYYTFEEALDIIRRQMSEKKEEEFDNQQTKEQQETSVTKESLRQLLASTEGEIAFIVNSRALNIRGMTAKEFAREAAHEFYGYSILADAFEDPGVSDIFCLRWNNIYVERHGKNVKYHRTFRSPKHFHDFIERVLRSGSAGITKQLNSGEDRMVDTEFYGDRIQATDKSVTPRDKSITFRKHSDSHVTLPEIIQQGVMDIKLAELFGQIILGELNLIYGGITGSGKTTSLRGMIDFFITQSNKRLLVCEDTQELGPKNDHTLELISVKNPDPKLAVELQDIIMAALRLKPKYIAIGEVRGKEAQAAVEAMETGHSTIFSMHGGVAINIINRLVTKYLTAMPALGIEVVERIIGSAVDFIGIQDDIPGIGRRVPELTEVSYDFEVRRLVLKPIFRYDFDENAYVLVNKISQDKGITMLRRGLKKEQIAHLVEGWEAWIPSDEKKSDVLISIEAALDELKEKQRKIEQEKQAAIEAAENPTVPSLTTDVASIEQESEDTFEVSDGVIEIEDGVVDNEEEDIPFMVRDNPIPFDLVDDVEFLTDVDEAIEEESFTVYHTIENDADDQGMSLSNEEFIIEFDDDEDGLLD